MKTIITALLLALVASPAFAAKSSYDSRGKTSSAYIGISGGQNKVDATGVTNTSTAYSVFGGYSFNDYVGVELAYTNFGSLDFGSNITLDSNAGSLSVVGSLPLGKAVSLFAKAGYASTTTQFTAIGIKLASESTSGAALGAGVQFNLGQRVGIRLGYDRYKVMLGTLIYDSNLASLGVLFKF